MRHIANSRLPTFVKTSFFSSFCLGLPGVFSCSLGISLNFISKTFFSLPIVIWSFSDLISLHLPLASVVTVCSRDYSDIASGGSFKKTAVNAIELCGKSITINCHPKIRKWAHIDRILVWKVSITVSWTFHISSWIPIDLCGSHNNMSNNPFSFVLNGKHALLTFYDIYPNSRSPNTSFPNNYSFEGVMNMSNTTIPIRIYKWDIFLLQFTVQIINNTVSRAQAPASVFTLLILFYFEHITFRFYRKCLRCKLLHFSKSCFFFEYHNQQPPLEKQWLKSSVNSRMNFFLEGFHP